MGINDQVELYDLVTAKQSVGMDKFASIEMANIVLVENAVNLKLAEIGLSGIKTVGFDIESKPTFIKGEKSKGPHLIQLATKSQAFLFHHSYVDGIKFALKILADEKVAKLGVGIGGDRKALREKYNQELVNVVDLAQAARPLVNGKSTRFGLQSLIATFLNQRLSKSKKAQLSNWAILPYSFTQIKYAANDAYALLIVWDEISHKL